MKRTITIALALAACDPSTTATPIVPDRVGSAPELEPDVELFEADPPTRLPGGFDPCLDYGEHPGVTFTHDTAFEGRVIVVDYCLATVANVAGCWASTHVADLGDLQHPTEEVDLVCAFECPELVEVAMVVGYPPSGFEAHVEIANPCPGAP